MWSEQRLSKSVAGERPSADQADDLGGKQQLGEVVEAAVLEGRAGQWHNDDEAYERRDEQQAHSAGKLERDSEVEGDEQAD